MENFSAGLLSVSSSYHFPQNVFWNFGGMIERTYITVLQVGGEFIKECLKK